MSGKKLIDNMKNGLDKIMPDDKKDDKKKDDKKNKDEKKKDDDKKKEDAMW